MKIFSLALAALVATAATATEVANTPVFRRLPAGEAGYRESDGRNSSEYTGYGGGNYGSEGYHGYGGKKNSSEYGGYGDKNKTGYGGYGGGNYGSNYGGNYGGDYNGRRNQSTPAPTVRTFIPPANGAPVVTAVGAVAAVITTVAALL